MIFSTSSSASSRAGFACAGFARPTFVRPTFVRATFVRATFVRATFVRATFVRATFVRATGAGVLCLGALLLAGCGSSNGGNNTTGSTSGGTTTGGGASGTKVSVFLLPKKKGVPYFTSCDKGAQKAADEAGVDLTYDGPTDNSPEVAATLIQKAALKGTNVIAVSPNDPKVLAPAMQEAKKNGAHVITWDADGDKDAREWFVNQANSEQIGTALVDTMVKDLGGGQPSGDVAIITASLTAANQNEWIKAMKERLKKYPKLNLLPIKPSNENQTEAGNITRDFIKVYPNLKGIWAISSVAFPGAAEAVKQEGKSGKVLVTGLSTPNDMKTYVKDGTVKSVILWNTEDLGALTVKVAQAVAQGKLKPGATEFDAGSLGKKKVVGDNILLGDILVFNKDNIDKYNF